MKRHRTGLLSITPAKRGSVRDGEHGMPHVHPKQRLPAQLAGRTHTLARGGNGVKPVRPTLDADEVPPEQVEPSCDRAVRAALVGRKAHEAGAPLGGLVDKSQEAALGVYARARKGEQRDTIRPPVQVALHELSER